MAGRDAERRDDLLGRRALTLEIPRIEIGAGAAIVAGILVLGVAGIYAAKRAGVLPGADTFNPASPDNLAYRGANAIGAALTGDQDFSLGARIWEWTHDEPDLTAPALPIAPREVRESIWSGSEPNPAGSQFWIFAP